MLAPNREITKAARVALQGRWWWAVGGCAIFLLVNFGVSMLPIQPGANMLVSLFLAGPFSLGISAFGLALQARGDAPLSKVFEGFDGAQRFTVAVGAYVLVLLFVLFWGLLLIVPGVIAALSYAMTFWVLAEEPDLSPMRALSRSQALMKGHRWQLFRLYFRFIGWYLLAIMTLGIGFFLGLSLPDGELCGVLPAAAAREPAGGRSDPMTPRARFESVSVCCR